MLEVGIGIAIGIFIGTFFGVSIMALFNYRQSDDVRNE